MTVSARSLELRSVAQHVADALPATVEEVVLTGSVSRGVADAVSDSTGLRALRSASNRR
jgi:hypothetical protein